MKNGFVFLVVAVVAFVATVFATFKYCGIEVPEIHPSEFR